MKTLSRQSGFSFIELSIAMIVIGTLLVVTMPYLKISSTDAKRKNARSDLTSALNALKGYAVARGAFPDFPDDGGGADIVYQLPTAKLGLQTQSHYQDIIYYDVNTALQFPDEVDEAAGQTAAAFCTAVMAEISKVETAITTDDPEPRVCNATTSCAPATIADQTSIALVLISRAKNAVLDLNNGDADRVYESSARGESDTYDDVMKSMTLYETADFFGCSDAAAGNWGQNWTGGLSGINCGGVAPPVVLHNGGSIDMFVRQENQVCWGVSPGKYSVFCNTNGWGASIDVDVSEDPDCNLVNPNSNTHTLTAASDINIDTEILISCADDYTACTVN